MSASSKLAANWTSLASLMAGVASDRFMAISTSSYNINSKHEQWNVLIVKIIMLMLIIAIIIIPNMSNEMYIFRSHDFKVKIKGEEGRDM